MIFTNIHYRSAVYSILLFQFCPDNEHYVKLITISSCNDFEFTCGDGQCVQMDLRCNGKTECRDGSDEQLYKMLVPSIGYNKYLIPPPQKNEKLTYIDFKTRIIETIFIDEDQKFMRLKQENTRFWYNSYLTFQNLKNNTVNEIQINDHDNFWKPNFALRNSENLDKCQRTEERGIFLATPTQSYVLNRKDQHQNAYIFKVYLVRKYSYFLSSLGQIWKFFFGSDRSSRRGDLVRACVVFCKITLKMSST